MIQSSCLFAILICALCNFNINAQNIEIPLISEEITLDGNLNENAWKSATRVDLIQHLPNYLAPASEDTDIRLFFTDKNLYIGAIMFDSEPDLIQSPSKKRDETNPDNDYLSVIIDTYNDDQNGMLFGTTPTGLRTDMTVSNDGVGQEPINGSWNTEWYVETSMNAEGWIVEMRIPLSSLRYEIINDETTMGFIFNRWIPRKNESLIFPSISPDYGDNAFVKVSLAQDFYVKGIKKENPIYITPYVLAGLSQSFELNDDGTAYDPNNKRKFSAGLDAKYSYKSNLTVDLTINTDFAQVEADDQQINLDRFSLFFPEKRQFFQERASLFNIRVGGPNRIFYSRRIGLNDNQILPIYGGMRLTGNVRDYELGLMNLQVGGTDSIATENFTVARLKKQIINPSSFVGGMLTNRIDLDGNYNTVSALDATFNLGKDVFLFTKFAQSFENEHNEDPFSIEQSRVFINLEKVTYAGFVYDISLSYAGKNYNPGMGFENRKDFISSWHILRYGWILSNHDWINKIRVNSVNNIYQNIENSTLESQRNSLGLELFLNNGFGTNFNFNHRFEHIFESFEIQSGQFIEAEKHRYYNFDASINTPYSAPVYISAMIEFGQYFNGNNKTISVSPAWNVGSGIQLSGYYQYSQIQLPNQADANLHLGRIKMLVTLNTKFSLGSFVQYNSSQNSVVANLRLRYNPKEGNDLYLVYNDDFNSNRSSEMPMLPLSSGRTILLKYNYMFKL